MRFSAFKIFSNSVCKRIITKGLGFRALLLYTISKVKLREDILVSQSIVPVEIPQYCRFDSKKRNGILFNVRIANLKFTFFRLDFLRNKIWYSSSMNDEASKQLTDSRFKRLVGVQRTTFEEMLAVLKTAYQLKHARSQWVEVTLVQSGVTISRTPLSSEDTVMIDATEVQINRPKKRISE
ncbi:degenerate transposase (orf1) [Streptococcus pneumoniae]|nr:degenerate transposase (orf1) [Streptococcus pneumoniae]